VETKNTKCNSQGVSTSQVIIFRLQYLLQEKLLTQRIVEDEFAKAKEALEGKP